MVVNGVGGVEDVGSGDRWESEAQVVVGQRHCRRPSSLARAASAYRGPTHHKHVLQPLPSPLIFRLADLYFDNHMADVKFKSRAKIDGLKLEY